MTVQPVERVESPHEVVGLYSIMVDLPPPARPVSQYVIHPVFGKSASALSESCRVVIVKLNADLDSEEFIRLITKHGIYPATHHVAGAYARCGIDGRVLPVFAIGDYCEYPADDCRYITQVDESGTGEFLVHGWFNHRWPADTNMLCMFVE